MFEKESNGMSEEERIDFVIALKRKMCLENGKVTDADVYFQGVKDGYNKAIQRMQTNEKRAGKKIGWYTESLCKWC